MVLVSLHRQVLYQVLHRTYPAHIAAAVCFKGEVKGDYMQLGNKRYVICDATYIGAGVGEAMPDLKRTPAQVVRID